MAGLDRKISQLNQLGAVSSADLFVGVDVGATETKKFTKVAFMSVPGPIGGGTPNTGIFTTLQTTGNVIVGNNALIVGTLQLTNIINEFSIDGTLVGNSDSAVPTEKAVKTYVDTQVVAAAIVGNESLSNGDTTSTVVFSIVEADANYGVAWSLVNTTDFPPSIYPGTIYDKTINGFSIIFSGAMDTNNYVLSWIVAR